ncbi:hypothetical protein FNV43_RR13568 [Rhamnella rubrinervis]|uniref:Uncharacterized protein n=1 Tax=Rhamnella rubrinervis TaxID=2594499 RepID=A0A8K0H1K4_9ROSA|nr:hypothetical protein FNV43_RR13568 [Rhamnella rubrinervis]
MEAIQVDESVRGQAEILQHISAYVTSMALKCAVDLRIADIIHSLGGGSITLSQIASAITGSSCPNVAYLERIMRLLVHKNIFTAHHPSDGGETLYGLTSSSKWILWDSKPSLAPYLVLQNEQSTIASLLCLSQCVKDGGLGFDKVHGCKIWEFTSANPEYNRLFNDAMSSSADILMRVFLPAYKFGFSGIRSLVDVGGGIGTTLSEIVKSYPHIKGINFDLPHVIASAPFIEGVAHIGGDMLEAVPTGDAILLKAVLHIWTDEVCIKILKNCRKAIPENTGKIIILDVVLELQDNNIFEESRIALDLGMMMFTGGKERTEAEWKNVLKKGGFPRYRITKLAAKESIIEAFPK